ncbi:Acyltransferase-like protein [Apostasia shenzhenica]|uniref:Acyltransferase-like protein n=1 Tax=Apostasia shenzhenica TaxID=1088818 RepID=A0A2I0AI91_9ASPA|nr:Acyltransferase-like protein [Apostasia shenzhenica]
MATAASAVLRFWPAMGRSFTKPFRREPSEAVTTSMAETAASGVMSEPKSGLKCEAVRPPTIPEASAVFDETVVEPRGIADFIEHSRELVRPDGGPPRWISPLDCGKSRLPNSPPLFFLPGIDGVGLGLIRHHQRLGKIFDVWCLHIPVMDRTPFEGLVEIVERTVRTENYVLPNSPIYLVGECLGACIALAVVARNPDIDFVLILSNPATSFSKSQLQYLSSFLDMVPEPLHVSVQYFFDALSGNTLRTSVASVEDVLPLQLGFSEIFSNSLAFLSFLSKILPKDSFTWKLKMLKSACSYVNARLHVVEAQTLVLASGRDQLFPSTEEAKRLCRILPNSRVRHFNNSGHNLFLEDSFDIVSVIKDSNFYRRSKHKDFVSDYLPLTRYEFQKFIEEYRWMDIAACPVMLSTLDDGQIVKGLAGIPSDGPAIFVGYHMLMGLELAPMVIRFLAEKSIHLRGVAHPFIFNRDSEMLMMDSTSFDYMRRMGAVPVSATSLYKLLSKKSFVLLYPGGSREALHRKGEEYKLFWPDQAEFVRMAARFGAAIIPFGVAGEDDMLELLLDYDDIIRIPFYNFLDKRINNDAVRIRTDSEGEVGKQNLHFPGLLPKIPGRFYYLFGKPIQTRGMRHELSQDREKAHKMYMHIKSEVEHCISYLKVKREHDPFRHILPRLLYQASRGFTGEVPTFEL